MSKHLDALVTIRAIHTHTQNTLMASIFYLVHGRFPERFHISDHQPPIIGLMFPSNNDINSVEPAQCPPESIRIDMLPASSYAELMNTLLEDALVRLKPRLVWSPPALHSLVLRIITWAGPRKN